MALVQRQSAEALARAQTEAASAQAAALAALARAQKGTTPTLPGTRAAAAAAGSNVPVFTDLNQLSADRPAYITLEMVNKAIEYGP
eukprot:1430539-Prymnesium_polylepis.1